ncbi:MAG: metalloprotease [Nanoarchaeota archaeon]|nr:metalloprotease [Nanoarchaeota archaeon]
MMHKTIKIGRIDTSRTEIIDILKAWLALSLAFTFIYAGASVLSGDIQRVFSLDFIRIFVISMFTAGMGFLLHELAHKFVAQHYGCTAEFRAWDQLLYLAVGLAVFIGFIFAAPGAVMISGMITRKENGLISAAGPATNYVLAMIFLGLLYLLPQWASIFATGFSINIWLGMFNLIPFGPLDGKKVFYWNKVVWGAMLAFGALFLFVF